MKKGKIHIKKKPRKKPIDLTSHGPVRDISSDGNMDCNDNLGYALRELNNLKYLNVKNQKVYVYVSDIRYRRVWKSYGWEWRPERITLEKQYTVWLLLRLWSEDYDELFNVQQFEKDKDFELTCLHKQGEKREGWGLYGAHVRQLQEVRAESDFTESIKGLSYTEQQKKQAEHQQELRKRTNCLVIG